MVRLSSCQSDRSAKSPKRSVKKMKSFEGKVVIVTGSSSGIGQAVAVAFAKAGASVTVHGRDEKSLQKTKDLMLKQKASADQIESVLGSLEEDKTLTTLVKKTVDKFKKIDILVNAAGIASKPGAEMESMENYEFVMAVNCRAPVRLTLLCAPHLIKTKGNVINISSIASFQPATMMPYYGMAKAALDQFTRNYALNLGQKGVRVNSINPGLVRTGFQGRMMQGANEAVVEAMRKSYEEAIIPTKKAGTPEQIADSVLFVATAEFMNGSILVIDGGSTLVHPSPPRD